MPALSRGLPRSALSKMAVDEMVAEGSLLQPSLLLALQLLAAAAEGVLKFGGNLSMWWHRRCWVIRW